jgi:RNA polymerase sigma factor (sigma-70 family)
MSPLVSDERLSRRLATGEAAAFDELYLRYSHRLAAYASNLLGDRAAGEDVAQVALLNAYQVLRRGQSPEKVRPWLYRIAHNEAVDLLARRRELLQGIELEDRPAPEDGSASRGALLDALAQLPDRQRRAYVLREVHGLRVAEIASELELAVPQVEQALFAARNRMAEELVFGDGLTCDAAQRLAEGPLAAIERRALRRHFRTCDRCRASGVRVAPGLSFDWLRAHLADLLIGGAAPASAKVGAVFAAGAIATGAAVGPGLVRPEPRPPRVDPAVTVAAARVAAPAAAPLLAARERSVQAAPAATPESRRQGDDHGGRREAEQRRDGGGDGRSERDSSGGSSDGKDASSGDGHGGGDDGGDHGDRAATTTTRTETSDRSASSHASGGSSGSSGKDESDGGKDEGGGKDSSGSSGSGTSGSSGDRTTTTTTTTPAQPAEPAGDVVTAVLAQAPAVTTTTGSSKDD